MKIRLKVTFVLLLGFKLLSSQQSPNWSSFYEQGFVLNPALTAHWSKVEVSALHRQEWSGFESAPETSSIGVQYPFLKRITKVSIGGYLEKDEVGPYSKQSAAFTYSYRIVPRLFGNKIDQLRLGLGIQGSQARYDPDRVVFFDGVTDERPDITAADKRMSGNVTFGVHYLSIDDFNEYKSHYYFGLAISQIIPGTLVSSFSTKPQAYLHAGYRILRSKRSGNFFEPNLLISYSWSRAINVMANLRYEKKNAYWAAVGAVSNGDLFVQGGLIMDEDSMLGFMLNGSVLKLGAKVDYSLTHLRPYAGTGFEAYLAYMFDL